MNLINLPSFKLSSIAAPVNEIKWYRLMVSEIRAIAMINPAHVFETGVGDKLGKKWECGLENAEQELSITG